MAINVSGLITKIDQILNDTTNNSVTQANRRTAISNAVQELYNDFEFDFTNRRYQLNYYDKVNYYALQDSVPDIAEPVDLRREEKDHTENFTRKSPREIAVEINSPEDNAFAIEQRDRRNYIAISYPSANSAVVIHNCDSTSTANEITLDTTNSDATNLTIDKGEFQEGSGAINFDLDENQSGNQRLTVSFNLNSTIDMTTKEDVASMIWRTYLPTITGVDHTMIGYWGENSSNYWSAIALGDADSLTFVQGWNRVKVNWADATKTGTPNKAKIAWARIDINHNATVDDTDYRIDDILMVKPEKLYLHYNTWYVGLNSTGTTYLTEFWDNTNIPFYSGVYDYFDTYVSHQASAYLFRQMGMETEATREDALAGRELVRLKKKFPKHSLSETSNFKLNLSW